MRESWVRESLAFRAVGGDIYDVVGHCVLFYRYDEDIE